MKEMVEAHHDLIWRFLRRLGVHPGDVDDGAQRVFLIAAAKLALIRPGSERSFLLQTALRVASDSRHARARLREEPCEIEPADDGPAGEDLLDMRRARAQLDGILDAMAPELRSVFVLFEVDELTMAEIAELLELPPGTVASRLRRAREEFRGKAARLGPGRPKGAGAK